MGQTDCRGIWILFWWAGPCSVNLLSNLLLWVGLCSLSVVWPEANCGRGNGSNGSLLQKDLCLHCCIQCPWPRSRPLSTHASSGDSWTLTAKSGSVWWGHCSFLLGPGAHKVLFVSSKCLFPQSCRSSVVKSHWPRKSNSQGVLSPFARSPGWEICCGSLNFFNSARFSLV